MSRHYQEEEENQPSTSTHAPVSSRSSSIQSRPVSGSRPPSPPLPPLPPLSARSEGIEQGETVGRQSLDEFRFDAASIEAEEDENETEARDPTHFEVASSDLKASARLRWDGRIEMSFDAKKKLPDLPPDYLAPDEAEPDVESIRPGRSGRDRYQVPKLNILLLIVGSRGDVQPYIALALTLVADGHRVRLGTHAEFKGFVLDSSRNQVEFFDIGGDPRDLMSYMVKNPGLMPGFESLTNGDIGKKTKMMFEIMTGSFRGAFYPDPRTGQRFAADALIANPPVFSHIHIAEYLGIPLQMTFTMPWTPTTSFCHPLVQIDSNNAEPGLANYLTYALANQMTWQGLAKPINRFRTKTLGLLPLTTRSGPALLDRLKLPWIYSFSPGLIPKPKDWRENINVAGFFFLDLASDYKPPATLENFLQAGPPPVYIGFGSVPVKDPEAMSRTLFGAVQAAGVRAIISTGWAGLASTASDPNIFILDFAVPHDYLFTKMSAVVHHGGAGTTAIGLLNGLPTLVVPFFGDQHFWGQMIQRAGAGPAPIPAKSLNIDNLAQSLRFLMTDETRRSAWQLGEEIRREDGVRAAVDNFYSHLPLKNMRCDIDPSRVAVWWSEKFALRLSAFAAQALLQAGVIKEGDLEIHRSREYDSKKEATDPFTAATSAAVSFLRDFYVLGVGQLLIHPIDGLMNMGASFPKGAYEMVTSVNEGFHNVPKLYGTKVRPKKRVTGIKTGFQEGAKAFYYGHKDGFSGLYTDPRNQYKKHGALGAIKGVGRSLLNVTFMPLGGLLGLVAHPANGAFLSLRNLISTHDTSRIADTRTADGASDLMEAPEWEQRRTVERFTALEWTVDARKKQLKDEALLHRRRAPRQEEVVVLPPSSPAPEEAHLKEDWR